MYRAWFEVEKTTGKSITGTHSAMECDALGNITAEIVIFLNGDCVLGEYDTITGKTTIR